MSRKYRAGIFLLLNEGNLGPKNVKDSSGLSCPIELPQWRLDYSLGKYIIPHLVKGSGSFMHIYVWKKNPASLSKCGVVDAKTNWFNCLSLLSATVVQLPWWYKHFVSSVFENLVPMYDDIAWSYPLPPSSATTFLNKSLSQIHFFCHNPPNPISADPLHVGIVPTTGTWATYQWPPLQSDPIFLSRH